MTRPTNERVPFAGRPNVTDIDIQVLIDLAIEHKIDGFLVAHHA